MLLIPLGTTCTLSGLWHLCEWTLANDIGGSRSAGEWGGLVHGASKFCTGPLQEGTYGCWGPKQAGLERADPQKNSGVRLLVLACFVQVCCGKRPETKAQVEGAYLQENTVNVLTGSHC